MKKRSFKFGGNVNEIVPASRQNIDQRTPSGVRPVSSPVIPVKSDVQGAMKHGGESKMSRSVKRMAVGGVPGPMDKGRSGGPGQGNKGPAPGGSRGQGNKGPAPGQGQGKSGAPGGNPNMGGDQGKGPAPGMRYPMGDGGGGNMGRMDPRMRNLMMQRGMGRGGPELDIGEGKGPVPGRGRGLPNAMMGMDQMGVASRAPGMKKGGKVSASSYRDMTGGAAGGIGRLEKSSIAAKTKSQKLKKGGKVKGYAEGKMVIADDDRDFKSVFADARRGKADEFMWRGKKYTTKVASNKKGDEPTYASQRAAQPGPDVDVYGDAARNRGKGGGRGGPASGGEAQMRSMNLYPFGTDSNNVDTMRDEKYAKDNRGKSGGRSGKARENTNARADSNAKAMEAKIRRTEGNMAERDAAYSGMKDDAFRAMLQGKQRTSAIGGGMREDPVYPMTSEEMRDAAREMNATVGGMRRGGKAKMAKGGKVKNFEGSFMDMAQDKKLAKKRGMSLKAWEKSPADAKHDKQQNMKGLKKGGMSKMAMGGYASGGMSTAQDGMKGALRPKPSAMAKGGKVKRMAGGGNSTEGFSYPYDDQAERQIGRENSRKSGTIFQALDKLDRYAGFSPKHPTFPADEFGNVYKNERDPKSSVSGPSRKQSAGTMAENKAPREGKKPRSPGTPYSPPYVTKKKVVYDLAGKPTSVIPDTRNRERVDQLGMKKGGKAEMHDKGCKCMACGGKAKMAKGGKVGMTFGKPLPGTKVGSQKIRSTVSTDGANMKKDGMKGQLRAKASGAKATAMMKPLGMTKMAKGGKVRGAGIAQRGTKFIGEV